MSYRIRRFGPADRAGMLAFTAALPEADLLFLGRDLRHPRVVEAWIAAVEEGWIDSLVADEDGAVVGSAALVRDPLGWSAHVGEVRLLVAHDRRGAGLGRDLLQAMFAVARAHGLAKLTATMVPDHAGSVALFEGCGFRREALLAAHVRDGSGRPYDLAILSHDLGTSRAA